jgi:hypothetical protein
MNPYSRPGGPPPRQSEGDTHDTFPERHYTPAVAERHDQYFHDVLSTRQASESLQAWHDFQYQPNGNANNFSQYQASPVGFDVDRTTSRYPQAAGSESPYAPHNDHVDLRGIENFAAQSSPGPRGPELGRAETALSAYNMHHRSLSAASGSPAVAPMPSLPPIYPVYSIPPNEQNAVRQTVYDPFQDLFETPEDARDYRRRATRFDRQPYIKPESDESIAEIERERSRHVGRIFDAMTSGEHAKDNPNSIAMKRWVRDDHYRPDLVEAYAHKLLDCLLQQAKEGFRGWQHNDYVADERKGEVVDKDVDCAQRLDNIVRALQQEKTICEDVMNSACQIRMFVNAPTAYANRKHQNRVGNSKRGRTKDAPDLNPKPTKARRTGGRQTRARSATASDMPSPKQQRQHLQPAQHGLPPMGPYYPAQVTQHLAQNPAMPIYTSPQSMSTHRPITLVARNSFAHQSINARSSPAGSPQTSLAYSPRLLQALPQQISPTSAPSPPPRHYFPTSLSPDDAKTVGGGAAGFDGWSGAHTFGQDASIHFFEESSVIDPFLSQMNASGGQPLWGAGDTADNFNPRPEGCISLSDIENHNPHPTDGSSNTFSEFWERQRGVQPFSPGARPFKQPHQP